MVSIIQFVTKSLIEYEYDPIYEYRKGSDITESILGALRDGDDDDIIGIMTHGRYIVRNNQPLIQSYIEQIMKKYDLILPYEVTIRNETGSERMFEPGAVIGRRSVLRDFYRSVNDSLGNLEDEMAIAHMLKTRIKERHLRVKGESVSKQSPELWNNGHKKITLLQNYTDAILNEYFYLRKTQGFEGCFAEEDPYNSDFGRKVPIWICWWQGVDNAPALVKACIHSIERNVPDNSELILITKDNWNEYVTFTDTIVDKFDRGIISVTHLADILRSELLYRYGGLWIDATYYVSRMIPEYVLSGRLYTTRFDPPLWGGDVMKGRWSTSLMAIKKHSVIMQFLMESWWWYWENTDELADYFMFDYLIDAGYRHFENIREEIDAIVPSPSSVYDLQLKLNQRVTEKEKAWLNNAGVFYKINRREVYREKTGNGFTSLFGYILGDENDDIVNGGSIPVEIVANSESELVNAIREINPSAIRDVDGFFRKRGYISRGIIDDVILHDLFIYPEGDYDHTDPRTGVYDASPNTELDSTCVAVITIDKTYRLECY